ncbi:phage tail protein [Pseudomonas sp. Au-Pse12]|uniref:phage tail protein n=1 Tax=Pseudomonas sp. Au-Pse12 TaxID=2906459 RepID=UPI001E469391|nr:phage tail protein [Pseudomonas sp. Au-Pse12]MCE4053491.1 phage tail protein [Pseudomonas sp. Au-Pse12]
MIDSNSQFFAILTAVGEAKQANATALGTPWTFKDMAVGDANGTDPIPNRTQTKLINEWRRAPVNQVRTDPANPNIIITEQVIPPDVGGRWIREIGLFDADGDLVAVANCAPSFKPLLAQGTGKTQVIRMNFIVANTAQIVLKIDPAVVLATREYVDSAVIEALAKLDFKHSAVVATTANIALSGIQTIDGVLLPADARVLVKNQAQAKDNGLYVVSSTGVWTRAQDADTSLEVTPGLFVSIEKGTVNGDSVWQLVTDGPIALGTTPLAFEMAIGRTGISAGSYANVTVDKYGRVIAGTNPSTLAGHGITDTYTKAEIESIVAQSSSLPVGSMVAFPRASVPPGFLEIDGSVQSIAAYPDLAAYLGSTFNKGDEGAGNFRLPESRGEFLRGWDHGRGVDLGRGVGSYQLDALQNITGSVATDGVNASPIGVFGSQPGSPQVSSPTIDSNTSLLTFDASRVVRTSTETRPRSLAVMWCIKAWGAPVNQGNIDVAALVKELAALKSAHPVGAILPFPKAEVPAGYLELNGSVQSIAAYPDLAAYLGTTFNKGDEGAGNFRLPESRGEFLRGWDHGRGVDVGRALGTWQADEFKSHTHPIGNQNTYGSGGSSGPLHNGAKVGELTQPTSPTGGAETRPRNLSVMWCIKAWNAPVNQGNIDVAALVKELAALKSAHPVGAIIPFPKAEVPPGYLELNGSVQSIAAYPDLAVYLGTNFNKGDEGAGNFRLPESRGEFLRGWDHGRGVDVGRLMGSSQADEFRSHTHVNSPAIMLNSTVGTGGNAWSAGNQGQVVATGAAGGTETRPRNLAVMWCIKAWNAPVNQGNIDIAALAPLAAQATENNQGTAKIATLTQLSAGTDDAVIATPKKLRFGFAVSLATNGYIAFPTWLGGLVIQWGYYAGSLDDQSALVQFPMAFPSSCMNVLVTADGVQSGGSVFVGAGAQKDTPGRFRLNGYGTGMPTVGYHWLALGY